MKCVRHKGLLLSLLSLLLSSQAFAEIVSGELLVLLKEQSSSSGRKAFIQKMKRPNLQIGEQGKFLHFKFSDKDQLLEEYRRLKDDADVQYVQPNYRYRAVARPTDPYFFTQWGVENKGQTLSSAPYKANNPGISGMDIGATAAWNIHSQCDNTVVAVLDTGINYTSLDLKDQMWDGATCKSDTGSVVNNCIHGYDFVDSDKEPLDYEGHGTHVAGIIGARANDGVGISGVCWTAKLMAVRVLDLDGGTSATIARGIDFAWRNGAKVINMSLGGYTEGYDAVLDQAMSRANAAGVYIVSAAGNDGQNLDKFDFVPCTLRGTGRVCVGAVDQKFQVASFSNYSSSKVDLMAPGTNIYSTIHGTTSDLFSEDFSSGWNLSSSTWYKHDLGTCKIGSPVLISYPKDYCLKKGHSGPVQASSGRDYLDLFKNYDYAFAHFKLYLQLAPTDILTVGQSALASINYTNAADTRLQFSAIEGEGEFSVSLRGCKGSDHCSLGVNFKATTSTTAQGAAFGKLGFHAVTLSNNSYSTYNGTSMAAPFVAGGIALLRNLNQNLSLSEMHQAIMTSGQVVEGLSGKALTSSVLNLDQLLRFVPAPTSVSAQQTQ